MNNDICFCGHRSIEHNVGRTELECKVLGCQCTELTVDEAAAKDDDGSARSL